MRHSFAGIGAKTFGVTMQPENGIPPSPTSRHSVNSRTPNDETSTSPRITNENWQNTALGTDATTRLFPET
jgi:hypothetical protein